MDAWINLHQQKNYDEDGNWARSGSISTPLLTLLLSEPYLEQPAPKSTGRELFNLTWLQQYLADPAIEKLQLSACDIQATLTEYTAQTIANEVKKTGLTATVNPNELLVCGGGAHNSILMQRLTELLPNWCVMTTADRGVDIDNMEAMAFAWLAYRTMHHQSGNLPEVTGARRLAQLGAIYPAD